MFLPHPPDAVVLCYMENNSETSVPDSCSQDEEVFEVVDIDGNVLGLATRREVHNNPSLLHRVVHVLVFDQKGNLLLQKRSQNKDIAPGSWDTSVGGHVNPGEDICTAALREMKEELGISECEPAFLYSYSHSNERESELVNTFSCIYEGPIAFNHDEIDEVRYWDIEMIRKELGSGRLSSNFEDEFKRYHLFRKTARSPF